MSMSHQTKKHASMSMFSSSTPHFDRLQFHWIMKLSSQGRALQHLESSGRNACEITHIIISQLYFCAKHYSSIQMSPGVIAKQTHIT